MSSTAKLCVAIYRNEGVYKHWSLFVNGPTDAEKIMFHVMGSSTRYRFEMRNADASKSASLLELIPLCEVPVSKIGEIKDAAAEAPIHNEYAGYNCQDYVLELLDDLEARDIIDDNNAEYMKQKKIVKSKQEGLA